MQQMSDLDFLKLVGFEQRVLYGLDTNLPISRVNASSLLLDPSETSLSGSFGAQFTHTPDEDITKFITGQIKHSIEQYIEEIESYKESDKSRFNEDEIEFESCRLEQLLVMFKTIPKFTLPDESHTYFEFINKYNKLAGDKIFYEFKFTRVPVSRIKDLYYEIEQFEHPRYSESTLDPLTLFYHSYTRQLIDKICDEIQTSAEGLNIPTLEQLRSERKNIESLFNTYSQVPENSLLIQKIHDTCYMVSRKIHSQIYSPYCDNSEFNPIRYTLDLEPTVTVWLNWNDATQINTKKKSTFTIGTDVQVIPKEQERTVLERIVSNLTRDSKKPSTETVNNSLTKIYTMLGIE